MGSSYSSITIKNALDKIARNEFVLPAIQRKYVWKTDQIELLFDSIMRGYPINSFMLWEISEQSIKQEFKFYQFIDRYVEKFKEDKQKTIRTQSYAENERFL